MAGKSFVFDKDQAAELTQLTMNISQSLEELAAKTIPHCKLLADEETVISGNDTQSTKDLYTSLRLTLENIQNVAGNINSNCKTVATKMGAAIDATAQSSSKIGEDLAALAAKSQSAENLTSN